MQTFGPYIVLDTLGRGGMGTVFRGKHRETGDTVAIKVLSKQFTDNDHFRIRFEAEIETLFKLHHPNIVQLISYGEDDGQMFFAMELVDGLSLFVEQKRSRRFQWRDVMLMTLDICEGLRHAHDRGIIHRDIKPGNLLLGPENNVKITDFGIAKMFGGAQLTADGGVVGTADYMSPEQAKGESVTVRSDLYSVGCVMYSLLANRPPLPSKNLHEAILNLTTKTPPEVDRFAIGIPKKLSRLVSRLLEKNPDKRIGSALALSKRLKEILEEVQENAKAKTQTASPHEDFDLVDSPTQSPGSAASDKTKRQFDQTQISVGSATKSGPVSDKTSGDSQGNKTKPFANEMQTVELTDSAKSKALEHSRLQKEKVSSPLSQPTLKTDSGAVAEKPEPDEFTLQKDETEQNTGKQSFFTEVEQSRERIRGETIEPVTTTGPVWPYILALTAVVGAALFGIFVSVGRTPGSDELYETIVASADAPGKVKEEMQQFLEKYPDDERTEEVNQLLAQANSGKFLRTIELKARLRGATSLLPIESAFVEAMEKRKSDPVAALKQLEAVAAMYESHQDTLPRSGEQCLSAIRGQINVLRPEVEDFKQGHLQAIESLLSSCETLQESDPEAAIKTYEGILLVYQDKNWTLELIETVKERLRLAKQKMAELDASNKTPKSEAETDSDSSDLEKAAGGVEKLASPN